MAHKDDEYGLNLQEPPFDVVSKRSLPRFVFSCSSCRTSCIRGLFRTEPSAKAAPHAWWTDVHIEPHLMLVESRHKSDVLREASVPYIRFVMTAEAACEIQRELLAGRLQLVPGGPVLEWIGQKYDDLCADFQLGEASAHLSDYYRKVIDTDKLEARALAQGWYTEIASAEHHHSKATSYEDALKSALRQTESDFHDDQDTVSAVREFLTNPGRATLSIRTPLVQFAHKNALTSFTHTLD